MMVDPEPTRRQTTQVSRATRDVVHAATGRALEMMVMRRFPHLVTRTFSGEGDDLDGPVSHKQLEIAIDRGHAQRPARLRALLPALRRATGVASPPG